MNHIELLGTDLKSDFIIDLLETYDAEVFYDFDRLHEGTPDTYRTSIPKLGLEFVFNEEQKLRTLFIRPVEIETWNPFDEKGIIKFSSKSEALGYAKKSGILIKEGKAVFMAEEKDWIKFEYETYGIHYEFVDASLKMITLQTN